MHDDPCQIIRDYFQSFGKGCQIITRAKFLEVRQPLLVFLCHIGKVFPLNMASLLWGCCMDVTRLIMYMWSIQSLKGGPPWPYVGYDDHHLPPRNFGTYKNQQQPKQLRTKGIGKVFLCIFKICYN